MSKIWVDNKCAMCGQPFKVGEEIVQVLLAKVEGEATMLRNSRQIIVKRGTKGHKFVHKKEMTDFFLACK